MENILKHMLKLRKSEAGQVMVYVTIIVALAALIITPILHFTYAGHQSARVREERTLELYAADAGIEDAMYQIKNADPLNPNDPISSLNYWDNPSVTLGSSDSWNDRDLGVTVEKIWIPGELTGDLYLASPTTGYYAEKLPTGGLFTNVEAAAAEDDFNSGGWSGGTGWDASWTPEGSASVSNIAPYEGSYHLRFNDSAGRVEREATSLSGFYEPQLRFYANAGSFESSDTAECQVSLNGEDWYTAMTWADGNDTGTYELVNINLNDIESAPDFGNATDFWVAFESNALGGTIASDNFASGGWNGNPTQWAAAWTHSGYSNVTTSGGPRSNYHLRLRSSTGYAKRSTNILNYTEPRLQFWAKASSWESGDTAVCRVSTNGTDWTTLKTWVNGEDTGVYTFYDFDLSAYKSSQFWLAFDANMNSTGDYFYIDDINIVNGDATDYFYVDNVWVGSKIDKYTLEVAYVDAPYSWPAYLDRLAVWLPPGMNYLGVVESFGLPSDEPTYIEPAFAGGTVVQWNFNRSVDLSTPVGAEGSPIVRSLSFTFSGGVEDQGMFVWMKACSNPTGDCGNEYLSWDKGYALYRTTSQASHEIWGTNTQVTAYVGQGELNKRGLSTYGNYVATGAPLLIDYEGSSAVKEKRIDPTDSGTWVTKDGFYYDARSDITDLPADSEMIAAWLYWSAFVRNSEWTAPDETVDFMFPKYYTESFDVSASPYNLAHYPVVDSPHQPQLYLYPLRNCGEELGTAYVGDGNNSFSTDFSVVLETPAPKVWEGVNLLSQGSDYTLNYATGNVTIINDAISGLITIDYSISDSQPLTEGDDYTLNETTGLVTITNSCLAGTVIINYWAETWQEVYHNAENEYGMALPPAETEVPLTSPVGHSYACFSDVTQLLKDSGIVDAYPGSGEYAVDNIQSTQGVDGSEYATRCFSGWSLIILYKSNSETAHQFYLYDPIHNPDDCPFMMLPSTDPGVPDPHEEFFSLKDFYPPAGSVQGRVTYFVGEGDTAYTGDYIQFKGVSQESYTTLADPPINPATDVMNTRSTTGERGIDIDTYDILSEVGSDTEADVRLVTEGDRWYLIYMILSFKTSVVPKADYAFNVAAITYSYELGTLE